MAILIRLSSQEHKERDLYRVETIHYRPDLLEDHSKFHMEVDSLPESPGANYSLWGNAESGKLEWLEDPEDTDDEPKNKG